MQTKDANETRNEAAPDPVALPRELRDDLAAGERRVLLLAYQLHRRIRDYPTAWYQQEARAGRLPCIWRGGRALFDEAEVRAALALREQLADARRAANETVREAQRIAREEEMRRQRHESRRNYSEYQEELVKRRQAWDRKADAARQHLAEVRSRAQEAADGE